MRFVVGLVLLAIGAVLLIMGMDASESLASDVSRFFTGEPTDRAMWMILGGVGAIVGGLAISLIPRRVLRD